MNFDSALFLFVAGLIVGGAVVYLLYTRVAVVAAELQAKVDAFENAFGALKADFGTAAAGAAKADTAISAALKTAATPPAPPQPAQAGATVAPPAGSAAA